MTNDIIQAQYEQLEQIAARFGRQAEATAQMQGRVQQSLRALQAGGWEGRGAAAFFGEMNSAVLPALGRLEIGLNQAQTVTLRIKEVLQVAEQEASEPFKGLGTNNFSESAQYTMAQTQQPSGPPPVPVPGDPTNEWKWNPNPQNRRGGSWGPKRPIRGQGQPSASWDPEGHWDVDDGKGNRQRYDKDGNPLTPEEAHNQQPKEDEETEISESTMTQEFLEKMAILTGLTGTALIIYLIISEGSRLFPPRNLLPIP